MNPDEVKRNDTERLKKQETLQDGMLDMIAQAEAALDNVGDRHHVLFVGEDVMNCRQLAGMLNMQGFACHYEERGDTVPEDTDTIVLATHDMEVVRRVKELANGTKHFVVMSKDGVPQEVLDTFPGIFTAWNFPGAFGHIQKLNSKPEGAGV
jgi:hypothetical protein